MPFFLNTTTLELNRPFTWKTAGFNEVVAYYVCRCEVVSCKFNQMEEVRRMNNPPIVYLRVKVNTKDHRANLLIIHQKQTNLFHLLYIRCKIQKWNLNEVVFVWFTVIFCTRRRHFSRYASVGWSTVLYQQSEFSWHQNFQLKYVIL